MESSTRGRFASFGALLLLVASRATLVAAEVPLNLCADFNTGETNRNVSIYQTNGLCSDFCRADYAYAVTQDTSCWCSNYTPDDDTQVDLGDCNLDCPAYPQEKCGGRGLWGYVELNGHLPSGTKGGDDEQASSTSSTIPPTTTTASETSVTETETEQTPVETETSSQEETSTTFTTSTSTTSSAEDETSTTPPESTRVETVTTNNGVVSTITIRPDPTGDADGSEDGGESSGGGLGTGAIVGIVVGVVGAILIGAGLVLWWFLRRRKQTREEGYQEDPSVRGSSSSRMGGSVGPEMASASSPASGAHNSNRNSTLQIDPRMDPFKQGLYARSGSHESINTLRDDHDYSRRILRATNPDPGNDN